MKQAALSIRITALAILCMLLSSCAAELTAMRRDRDFVLRNPSTMTVLVLDPEVKLVKMVFSGRNERMRVSEKDACKSVEACVERGLKEAGFSVQTGDVEALTRNDPELMLTLLKARLAYGSVMERLYYEPLLPGEQAFAIQESLGPVVNLLGDRMNVDAVFFCRLSGFKKATGQMAKEVAASVLLAAVTGVAVVPEQEGGVIDAALVDVTTGRVLWANVLPGFHAPDTLGKYLMKSFAASRKQE